MPFGIDDSIENGDLCNDVHLRMDYDARFRFSELYPSEHSHIEVYAIGAYCKEDETYKNLI